MSQRPGKKIGTLEVKLDRKKTCYKWASVEVELSFDLARGAFRSEATPTIQTRRETRRRCSTENT